MILDIPHGTRPTNDAEANLKKIHDEPRGESCRPQRKQ